MFPYCSSALTCQLPNVYRNLLTLIRYHSEFNFYHKVCYSYEYLGWTYWRDVDVVPLYTDSFNLVESKVFSSQTKGSGRKQRLWNKKWFHILALNKAKTSFFKLICVIIISLMCLPWIQNLTVQNTLAGELFRSVSFFKSNKATSMKM